MGWSGGSPLNNFSSPPLKLKTQTVRGPDSGGRKTRKRKEITEPWAGMYVQLLRPKVEAFETTKYSHIFFFEEGRPNHLCGGRPIDVRSRPCLVHQNSQLWHYAKRRFPVTSNLQYIHRVLNVDEIKKIIAQFGCTLRYERFEPN